MLISQRCPKTKGSLPHKLVIAGGLKYKYESIYLDMHVHLLTSFIKLGGNWFTINVCKKFAFNHVFILTGANQCTPINFGFMYSWKRISKNSFPNFIYIFPKSFMKFCLELRNPKRNYENQAWTEAPKEVILEKY